VPTYEYECKKCGHVFEEFQRITAEPLTKCPKCSGKLVRLPGAGAGIIFKGSGFYATDYRSEGYKRAAKAESPTHGGKGVEPGKPAQAGKPAHDAGKAGGKTGSGEKGAHAEKGKKRH
jgi:putative FmdB family regulatory protein